MEGDQFRKAEESEEWKGMQTKIGDTVKEKGLK